MSSEPNRDENITSDEAVVDAAAADAAAESVAAEASTPAGEPSQEAAVESGEAAAAEAVPAASTEAGDTEAGDTGADNTEADNTGADNTEADNTEADNTEADKASVAGDAPVEAVDSVEDAGDAAVEAVEEEEDEDVEEPVTNRGPIEEAGEEESAEEPEWYILKVQVNRENNIRDALERRVKIAGLEQYFGDIIVPTENVKEFNRNGKARIVKRKLYPGYIMVNMVINDDTWFLVRETSGIGDFTGSAGKPTPMDPAEVARIRPTEPEEGEEEEGTETGEKPRIAIAFEVGNRVRVKEGYFQNFEGDVEAIDQTNGQVSVLITIFGRRTPVELQHWQIEKV